MKAKNTDERQLKREIRWTREALAIAENCETHHSIQEAHSELIPVEFRHLKECMESELQEHLNRLSEDLRNLQSGEWDTSSEFEGAQKDE